MSGGRVELGARRGLVRRRARGLRHPVPAGASGSTGSSSRSRSSTACSPRRWGQTYSFDGTHYRLDRFAGAAEAGAVTAAADHPRRGGQVARRRARGPVRRRVQRRLQPAADTRHGRSTGSARPSPRPGARSPTRPRRCCASAATRPRSRRRRRTRSAARSTSCARTALAGTPAEVVDKHRQLRATSARRGCTCRCSTSPTSITSSSSRPRSCRSLGAATASRVRRRPGRPRRGCGRPVLAMAADR